MASVNASFHGPKSSISGSAVRLRKGRTATTGRLDEVAVNHGDGEGAVGGQIAGVLDRSRTAVERTVREHWGYILATLVAYLIGLVGGVGASLGQPGDLHHPLGRRAELAGGGGHLLALLAGNLDDATGLGAHLGRRSRDGPRSLREPRARSRKRGVQRRAAQ